MRILVVEDEYGINAAIKKGLTQEGHAVDSVYDGEEALDMALGEEYDIIILDLMLPKISGIEVLKKIREEKNFTPVLILSAKGELSDKVTGLNLGADDYLVKPFAFEELLARIKATTRRPKNSTGTKFIVKDLELDTNNYDVKRSGKNIILSKKEYSLLEFLMKNKGKLLTKDQIISRVWNYDADILPNTVEVYIGYLRKKIDRGYKNKLIQTIRGFGYKIGNTNENT